MDQKTNWLDTVPTKDDSMWRSQQFDVRDFEGRATRGFATGIIKNDPLLTTFDNRLPTTRVNSNRQDHYSDNRKHSQDKADSSFKYPVPRNDVRFMEYTEAEWNPDPSVGYRQVDRPEYGTENIYNWHRSLTPSDYIKRETQISGLADNSFGNRRTVGYKPKVQNDIPRPLVSLQRNSDLKDNAITRDVVASLNSDVGRPNLPPSRVPNIFEGMKQKTNLLGFGKTVGSGSTLLWSEKPRASVGQLSKNMKTHWYDRESRLNQLSNKIIMDDNMEIDNAENFISDTPLEIAANFIGGDYIVNSTGKSLSTGLYAGVVAGGASTATGIAVRIPKTDTTRHKVTNLMDAQSILGNDTTWGYDGNVASKTNTGMAGSSRVDLPRHQSGYAPIDDNAGVGDVHMGGVSTRGGDHRQDASYSTIPYARATHISKTYKNQRMPLGAQEIRKRKQFADTATQREMDAPYLYQQLLTNPFTPKTHNFAALKQRLYGQQTTVPVPLISSQSESPPMFPA